MTQRMGEQLALALALEGRIEAARGETAQLVVLADVLAALPEPEIDQDWAAALEARLLGEDFQDKPVPVARPHLTVVKPVEPAERPALEPNVVQMPKRRVVVRRWAAAVAVAAAITALPLSSMASALPGSPFYGAKRALERLQIRAVGTPAEDAFAYMKFSARRLDEASRVPALGGSQNTVAALISEAKADQQAGSALLLGSNPDAETLAEFQTALAASAARMRDLTADVTAGAKAALESALAANGRLQQAVAAALGDVTPVIAPLGSTTAGAPQVSTTDGTAEEASSSTGDDGQQFESSEAESVRRRADDARQGTGKNAEGGDDDACRVAGSADGLGDLLAPLTHVTCSE